MRPIWSELISIIARWSSHGRVHPGCHDILLTLAQGAARRRGVGDYHVLFSRLRRNVGVETWKRLALMVHACLPKLSDGEEQLLAGEAGDSSELQSSPAESEAE